MAVLVAACGTGEGAPHGGDFQEPPRWAPRPADQWEIQLQGAVALREDTEVYDVDLDETAAAAVQEMHDAGAKVVCYLNAGAVEDWRSDSADFPAEVIGEPMDGWPGERWLDVRRIDVLEPIMRARIEACRAKGFDAIDPDNVEGYANPSGFDLTVADAVAYFDVLARIAHEQGMSIGLKNGAAMVTDVVDLADFAVNEQCQAFGECDGWKPFAERGKAVLNIEYEGGADAACAGRPDGFTTVYGVPELDRPVTRC